MVEPQPNVKRNDTSGRPSAVSGLSIRKLEAGFHAVVWVREDPVLLDSVEETGLELPALVGCELLGAAKTSNPD